MPKEEIKKPVSKHIPAKTEEERIPKTPLGKFLRDFLNYLEIERGRSIQTRQNYLHYLVRFLEQTKASKPGDITDMVVREFRLWLNRQLSGLDKAKKNTLSKKMINLSSLDENSKLLISIKEQQVVIKFKCFMENFMNFYYKIIDLKLEGYFSNYIYLFLNSDKYKIYMDNLDLINKSSRWYSSLQENINPKTKLIK